jgi:hypothetical protein
MVLMVAIQGHLPGAGGDWAKAIPVTRITKLAAIVKSFIVFIAYLPILPKWEKNIPHSGL